MKRGEIWLVNLDPTIGSEIKKSRPSLIISRDGIGQYPVKVVIPFTEWKDHHAEMAWMVRSDPTPENGLSKVSGADTLQIRAVSHQRFVRQVGVLSDDEIEVVLKALALAVGMPISW
jgi:mRNA interferase MazF